MLGDGKLGLGSLVTSRDRVLITSMGSLEEGVVTGGVVVAAATGADVGNGAGATAGKGTLGFGGSARMLG